jgi:hypothetical protein
MKAAALVGEQATVSQTQEFMIKEKKGILKPTGFGRRDRLAIPEG